MGCVGGGGRSRSSAKAKAWGPATEKSMVISSI
ncbi:hypothetical protein TIFTF001_055048 [Ficus carica]|uniref:Uncharacterized protein n=1 Tax=Ficus carica TaxID=3494 RepID=A0AA88E9R0_FICCA|nr:hypothetical protein TIFTF001_055048 [Ficus carica]